MIPSLFTVAFYVLNFLHRDKCDADTWGPSQCLINSVHTHFSNHLLYVVPNVPQSHCCIFSQQERKKEKNLYCYLYLYEMLRHRSHENYMRSYLGSLLSFKNNLPTSKNYNGSCCFLKSFQSNLQKCHLHQALKYAQDKLYQ